MKIEKGVVIAESDDALTKTTRLGEWAFSMNIEVGLLILLGVCSILACVIPGTELWLACRPIREDYKPTQYPGFLTFVLYILAFILGLGIAVLILFNELTNMGIEKIPKTIDQAIDDLNNYHSGTTVEFRKCLTRSLDVASEAIMADLDNIDELLGKPVQVELSYETGLENTLTQLLNVANLGSVSAYYTVNSDLNNFKTVNNIIDETIDNKIQKTSLGDLVKTLIDTDKKSSNYKQTSSNDEFLITNDDKKVSNDDLFFSLIDKKAPEYHDPTANDDKAATSVAELIIVVNAAKSVKHKKNFASDNEISIKDLIKLLIDKKEALNFLTFESDQPAINHPKVNNFQTRISNHQNLAITDDEKIFNEVIPALRNGEANLEEPISDLITAVDDDDDDDDDDKVTTISDFIIDVNPGNIAIIEANIDKSTVKNFIETFIDANLDKTSIKDYDGVKNEGSSMKLITNDEKKAVNHLLKALVDPKIANLEESVLNFENLVPNDDVIPMGDFVEIINDLIIGNLDENPTGNTKHMINKKEDFIDNNFKKLNSLKYYPDIIKNLGNDLKVDNDQEKGDYYLDKYFFYDIDEPVGYEYYPVVAKKIDDKKKQQDPSQDIGVNANNLIKNAERAKELTAELTSELNRIKRDLEKIISSCSNPQDRLLCSTINTNGLVINFQINKILRDERLLRLRSINRDNLTEDARRARGEYLYVPHHISRSTLDMRNQIRRELSLIRGRLFYETRNLESSNLHFNRKIESIKKYIHRDVVPYILEFEETRWLCGIATVILVFFVWILLISALICWCTSSDNKIRTALLCGSFFNCIISIFLWLIMILMIFISTHTELILCRALEGDRNYKTLETIIESKHLLGKPLEMSLKDFIE
ncbi:hypothetical protein G9C98_001537 [Cotesia typhae]|uniref:Uncharacterized protein n=1 Tax=Cotesia typhae TaxID=2053667 RepID=A0A8J5QW75_9HYME|nr:hypothetical protein G9C98_001537 [Cotesia typhae]